MKVGNPNFLKDICTGMRKVPGTEGARPPKWVPITPEDIAIYKKIVGNKFYHAVAKFESNMNPLAENPVSTARGLFQLIHATRKAFGVTNWKDPTQNFNGFLALLKENIGIFNTHDPLILYSAHYLGATVLRKHLIKKPTVPTFGQQLIVDEFYKTILPRFKETYLKTEIVHE